MVDSKSVAPRHALMALLSPGFPTQPLDVLTNMHQQRHGQAPSSSSRRNASPEMRSSESESDDAENVTPSSRQKCSLAFILATSSTETNTAREEAQRFDRYYPGHSGAPAAFNTHTPTNEMLKTMKRRRVPSEHNSSGDNSAIDGSSKLSLPPKKGSKYCIVEGCGSRAKHARKCWKHGGSVKCKVLDCVNRAKTKGVCWSHGGGTICSFNQCATISVSNGVCWAHGGGKRCAVEGCSRPAYERTENLCTLHFDDKKKIKH